MHSSRVKDKTKWVEKVFDNFEIYGNNEKINRKKSKIHKENIINKEIKENKIKIKPFKLKDAWEQGLLKFINEKNVNYIKFEMKEETLNIKLPKKGKIYKIIDSRLNNLKINGFPN